MSAPLLVVIHGAPGSGKTTLARRLRQDLTLPILGKDDLKELLFETIPQSDRDFSRLQGAVAADMLYAFARCFLSEGQSVMIEGAFWAERARKDIHTILDTTNAKVLELFCHVDEEVRLERFHQRLLKGERHPALVDTDKAITQSIVGRSFERLAIGDCIDVDTNQPISDDTYREIVNAIQTKMEG